MHACAALAAIVTATSRRRVSFTQSRKSLILMIKAKNEVPEGVDGLRNVCHGALGLCRRIIDVRPLDERDHQASGLPNHSHDAYATPLGLRLHWTTMTLHRHRSVRFRAVLRRSALHRTKIRGNAAVTWRPENARVRNHGGPMNNRANDPTPPTASASAGAPAPTGTPSQSTEDPELTAPRECPDCRPKELDRFRCRAEGVKAEADYDAAHQDGPNADQYEAARLQYGKARHDATPVVAEVRGQLVHVTDQLRCIIDDAEIVECLDDAWLHVKRRLEVCEPHLGCCVTDDGDFDADVDDCGIEILKARIAEYEHRTASAEKCFEKLLKEPEALTERVTDLQAEVAKIATDVGGDPGTTDFKRLYARALVAQQHLDEIWWGYDYPHDYVDCLCIALRISLQGRAALSRLTGELAMRECRIEARLARCKHLRENIVDGIIEEYVRRCQPRRAHDDECEHPRHPDDDCDDYHRD